MAATRAGKDIYLEKPIGLTVGQSQALRQTLGRYGTVFQFGTQHIYAFEKVLKMDLLLHMIEDWRMFSVLVFSRTKYGADKINRRLKRVSGTKNSYLGRRKRLKR